jgi:hypothetical protein
MGRKEISQSKYGDVIKYKNDYGGYYYLVVEEVKGGIVNGQIAAPRGVNGVSIDELVKNDAVILEEKKK